MNNWTKYSMIQVLKKKNFSLETGCYFRRVTMWQDSKRGTVHEDVCEGGAGHERDGFEVGVGSRQGSALSLVLAVVMDRLTDEQGLSDLQWD